jgi:amino acid transporter
MCLSIAAFAFVGVEITAATALEARARPRPDGTGSASFSVQFSATWISFLAAIVYFLGALLMSLNVPWDDPGLPRVSWLGSPINSNSSNTEGQTNSGFVISAKRSGIPGLGGAFTVILLITALTAANTNLYVASRTLFGLTRDLDFGNHWYSPINFFAFFGRTNRYKVPVRAMALSCCLLWVPFLYLSPNNTPGTAIATLLEVLSQLGSVSCVMVWACECWAFLRYYNCMKRHRAAFRDDDRFAHVRRFDSDDRYPWKGHGQPLPAVLAIFGCLFILVIANGAALWKGFNKTPFLAAYLAPLCFLTFWFCLKVYRAGGPRNVEWSLVDLSNADVVKAAIERLDDIGFKATGDEGDAGPNGWGNLWGII